MRRAEWWDGIVLAGLLAVAVAGCDGSGAPPASSSSEQAKVTGKVTEKGKPLAKIEVRFNAANINRKSAPTVTAMTGEDGSYTITSLVGQNSVTLGGAAASKNSRIAYFSKPVELKAGENTVDIDIP